MPMTYEEFLRISLGSRVNDDSEATSYVPTSAQVDRAVDRARAMGMDLDEEREFEEWAAIADSAPEEPDLSDW